uniref:Baseplate protein n=1 Tax=Siphoviridae sp. ctzWr28 TaxID=2827980 RepID=A0A8S5SCH4_9CAUD|nr:MAG TPA: baseplate protein [Siphoviridae sp. ctzWr28]
MAKLTKFKAQQVEFPTHYKVEDTNRGDTKIKNIIPAFGTIRENGTPETEEIYNGLQLGNVHTLQANKTTNLNIDYYVCNLEGLTEFGVNNDLKLRINVDTKNTNATTKLKLNNIDYTLLKEYNGTLKQIEAGDFKPNKSYELVYNGNQFVVINITEFGTETDTVLEGKRLAEIIGLEYGGNIQNTGTKTTGKFYYDKALKYYYECIANNNLTYNDGSKFRAISNKPILDKLENLYEIENQRIQVANGDVIFTKKGKTVTVMVRLQNDGNNITFHENQQLLEIPLKFRPTSLSYGFEAALASSSLTPGFNGATRMQINPTNITIWGAHLGRFNVLKGSATYFID